MPLVLPWGCERLVLMINDQHQALGQPVCDAYLLVRGDNTAAVAQQLAESLRDQIPRLNLQVQIDGGGFKSQMRKADKSGARLALILGESEIASNTITIKYLRETVDQQEISQDQLAVCLHNILYA